MEEKTVRRRHRRDPREERHREQELPPENRKSAAALACMTLIVLVGVFIPGGPDQTVHGILFTAAGLVMLIFPPQTKVPRLLPALAVLFLALAALSFLPRDVVGVPGWRVAAEQLGLDTGTLVTPHPAQAAQVLAGAAITLAVGLYLLGHRAGQATLLKLGLFFAVGTAVYAGVSMLIHHGFWSSPWDTTPTFGLFPNRNHTATLLSMGTVVSLGVLLQAVREKKGGMAGIATITAVTCLWGLVGFSISRSGVLLPCVAVPVWLGTLGKSFLSRKAAAGILAFTLVVGGLYWWADTSVKSRVADTMERATAEGESGEADLRRNLEDLDFRVPIQRDAVDMILAEPWTGSGGGTFRFIYPQHRARSIAVNDGLCYHPESDWLLAAAEWGTPATLALMSGVGVALWLAFRRGGKQKSRPLRLACLVGAAIVPFHGLIDVPGHRAALAWGALLLLAMAFPAPAVEDGKRSRTPSPWMPRLLGMLVFLAGLALLRAQWFGGPELAQVRAERLQAEAWALFAQDNATRKSPDTPPDPEAPLLREALAKMEEAVRLMPLRGDYHYLRGALALQFDDQEDLTDRSFALQRLLDPSWIAAPLRQAKAWSGIDPDKTYALWEDALGRSRAFEKQTGGAPSRFLPPGTFSSIMTFAKTSPQLSLKALPLAEADPALLKIWASRAPAAALNSGLPWLLAQGNLPEATVSALLDTWSRRGGKAAVKAWRAVQPEPPSSP